MSVLIDTDNIGYIWIMKIQSFKSGIIKYNNKLEMLTKEISIFQERYHILNKRLQELKLKIYNHKKNSLTALEKKENTKSTKGCGVSFVIGLIVFIYYAHLSTYGAFWVGFVLFVIIGFLGLSVNLIIVGKKKKINQESGQTTNYIESKKRLKELEKEESDYKTERTSLVEKIKYRKQLITTEKKKIETLNELIVFNQKHDVNDNNKIDIAEAISINVLLKTHQVKIREIEKLEKRDYLRDFSKINIFLNSFQEQLLFDYAAIQDYADARSKQPQTELKENILEFEKNLKVYKTLIASLVLMIINLINDNLLGFYELKEIFDKLSIFESNYEKKMISELSNLNNLTKQLITVTEEYKDSIFSALCDIDNSISDVSFQLEWMP